MGPTFRRTRKGQEELVMSQHGLPEAQRKILLYANGRRSMDELKNMLSEVNEDPDMLMAMQELGFLEMHDPDVEQASASQASPQQSSGTREGREPRAQPSSAGDARAGAVGAANLAAMKRDIVEDLTKIMGKDARDAASKIDGLTSKEEVMERLPRIHELVKLYAGARTAEQFYQRHSKK